MSQTHPDPWEIDGMRGWVSRIPLGFRLLAATSLPFGLAMGILLTAEDQWEDFLRVAALSGAFSGIIMTIVMGVGQVLLSSNWGERSAILRVSHTVSIVVHLSEERTLELAATAFRSLGARDIQTMTNDMVLATTPMDRLSARVEHVSEARTILTINSQPRWWVVVIDNGRNYDNVKAVQEWLVTNSEAWGGSYPHTGQHT